MESFINFCKTETPIILDSCKSLTHVDRIHVRDKDINVAKFYSKWKQLKSSLLHLPSKPFHVSDRTVGSASAVCISCRECEKAEERNGRRSPNQAVIEPDKVILIHQEVLKTKSEFCHFDIFSLHYSYLVWEGNMDALFHHFLTYLNHISGQSSFLH